MGVMDKFLNYMKLNDEEEGYYDDDDYLEDEPAPALPVPKKTVPAKDTTPDPAEEKTVRRSAQPNKITQMRQTSARRVTPGNSGMEVCVIKPSSVEEAREVTETLLSNRTVVLNLEGLDMEIAQRIIDFTSGSCYAINGNLQKISHYIFIITPPSVDISGDFQDLFGNGAFDSPLNSDL